jgi:glycosyltransferase involved in cell wall biosynthesis
MVKVFICIPTLVKAGAERFVTELASKIDKREVDVSVVVTNHLDKNTAFYNQLNKVGIDVFDVSDKSYFKEFVKIRNLLKEYKPEIVHTNVGSALHMLIPTWMQGRKVKHIFTAHSMGYRIFSGFKKKIMQIAFKTRIVIPVAICDTVKKSICESYNLAESMVPCVYNGVDTTKFAPKEQYCADGITRFVSVGTLYELKNHSMLIEAFNIVRKKCDNVKLTIVGGGVLYGDLMQQIKNLNLENSFEHELSTFSKYYDMYKKEFEFLWNSSTPI